MCKHQEDTREKNSWASWILHSRHPVTCWFSPPSSKTVNPNPFNLYYFLSPHLCLTSFTPSIYFIYHLAKRTEDGNPVFSPPSSRVELGHTLSDSGDRASFLNVPRALETTESWTCLCLWTLSTKSRVPTIAFVCLHLLTDSKALACPQSIHCIWRTHLDNFKEGHTHSSGTELLLRTNHVLVVS